jgi:hypothetical protein
VLNGTYPLNDLASPPPHTVGHSLLSLPTYANLPGGNGLPVALSRSSDAEFVQEAANVREVPTRTATPELTPCS